MDSTSITITYDMPSGGPGCTAVRLPDWLTQVGLPKQKVFYKLAAQNANHGENREQIAKMHDRMEQLIAEAKAAVEAEENGARPEYARRAMDRPKGRLERFTKALSALNAAMSKYDKTTKR